MNTKEFNLIDKAIASFRLKRIKDNFNSDDEVLDFGCGYQLFLVRYLQNKVRSCVGIDYDIPSQEISKGFKGINFRFINQLPFKNLEFNKISMLAVLEHLDEDTVPMLFQEFRRVLRPNGKIIITTPTPRGKKILEFLAFKLKIISTVEVMDHKKYYSYQDIEIISKKFNFTINRYNTFMFGGNSFYILTKRN